MSRKKLFISLGSIKDVTGILLSFLPVILFILDHQSFVPDLDFRLSFRTALSWFLRISLLIWVCIRVLASLSLALIGRSLCFNRCFIKGDINGGSLVDVRTLINGKLFSNFCQMVI